MITVYLSNNNIQVVIGEADQKRTVIRKTYYTLDTEGVLINGTVTDQDQFKTLISAFWKENGIPVKGISLVINSTQFITRLLEVPMLKEKKLFEYIPREFADVERTKEPVYTYYTIGRNPETKLMKIMATMVESSFMRGYIDIFSEMGIQVTGIECALTSLVKMLGKLPNLRNKTSVIMIVDGVNVENILLVNGEYAYSSRNRVFNQHGTPGFGVEIARAVSNILQFAQSEKIPYPITNIYLGGLEHGDFEYCEDSIYQVNQDFQVSELTGDGYVIIADSAEYQVNFGSFVYPASALLNTDKRLAFLTQLKVDKAAAARKKEFLRRSVPVFILAGIAVAVTSAELFAKLWFSAKLRDLEEYNQSPEVVADCLEYDLLQNENAELTKRASSVETAWNYINSYPIADSGVVERLETCAIGLAAVEVTSFDAASGLLQFNATAPQVELVNQFIELLRQEDIFVNVNYTGYAYQDSTGIWTVNVVCYLSEWAGKEKHKEEAEE